MQNMTNQTALLLLQEDAELIKSLIKQQSNTFCIAQCKAFEELIDTQMYGLSREVLFAKRLGLIDEKQGQSLLFELEQELNELYTDVYDSLEGGALQHGSKNE